MSVADELREVEGQLVRHIESLRRRIEVLQATATNMRAVLSFHRVGIGSDDFLPNMSVRRLLGRGETRGYCMEALKAAPDGLDTRELARYVMVRKGLDADDDVLVGQIVRSVAYVLMAARRKKIVRSDGKRNGRRLWRIEDRLGNAPTRRK